MTSRRGNPRRVGGSEGVQGHSGPNGSNTKYSQS